MGTRSGGYAALVGVTLQHGIYRCAVAIGADSDVEREYQRLASRGDQTDLLRLRTILGDPHDLATVSPAAHAADADAPIMLMHAKNDTAVDYEQSVTMQHALQRADKPVELVALPDEAVLLDSASARQKAMEAALGFIARHNPAAAAIR